MKNRLPSFTIIELVITMFISAIVTSFAYYSYSIFQSQLNKYKDRTGKIREYRNFSTALHFDFEKAEWIRDTIDQQHLVLGFLDTLILYSVQESQILRQVRATPSDAINDPTVDPINANCFEDSFPIRCRIINIRKIDDTLQLIDEIHMALEVNKAEFLLTEDKTYSAQQLIKASK